MIAVFAADEEQARAWMRCSGTDPASCLMVTRPRMLLPIGVYEQDKNDMVFHDATEFTEIVEVGLTCWWRWHASASAFFQLLEDVRDAA